MRHVSYSELVLPHLGMHEQVLGMVLEHLQCVNASYVLIRVINFKWKCSSIVSMALNRNIRVWLLIRRGGWGVGLRGVVPRQMSQNNLYFQQVQEILTLLMVKPVRAGSGLLCWSEAVQCPQGRSPVPQVLVPTLCHHMGTAEMPFKCQ